MLGVLSGKPIRIDKIRSEDQNPGLRGSFSRQICCNMLNVRLWADYEVSLLRLLERVTNGTIIEISVTGECNTSRIP